MKKQKSRGAASSDPHVLHGHRVSGYIGWMIRTLPKLRTGCRAVLVLALLLACKIPNRPPVVPNLVSGPDTCDLDSTYGFTALAFDPDGDSTSCQFNWGDSTRSGWSDYAADSTDVAMSKSWSAPGSYAVAARARDIRGASSDWSVPHSVVVPNPDTLGRPLVPSIVAAPDSGYDHFIYDFSFCGVDPESAHAYLDMEVDWGDGTEFEELYSESDYPRSGETVPAQHAYMSPGTYGITLHAWDWQGSREGQTGPREITIRAAPSYGWTRTYGGNGRSQPTGVTPMSDGGYTVTGVCRTVTLYDSILLVRTDPVGNFKWMKQIYIGDSGVVIAATTRGTPDNGYITAATLRWNSSLTRLIRCNALGERVWQKTYDGLSELTDVRPAPDGDYITAGGGADGLILMKTDSAGDSVWTRTYPGVPTAVSLDLTTDGGCVVAGQIGGVHVTRTDAQGALIWDRSLDLYIEEIAAIRQTSDGGYIIAGSSGGDMCPCYAELAKLDAAGTLMWDRWFNFGGNSWVNGIEPTPVGGCIMVGWTEVDGYGDDDIYIARMSASGQLLWQRLFGSRDFDEGTGIAASGDGGYVVTGHLGSDACLIKVDSNGFSQPSGFGKGKMEPKGCGRIAFRNRGQRTIIPIRQSLKPARTPQDERRREPTSETTDHELPHQP